MNKLNNYSKYFFMQNHQLPIMPSGTSQNNKTGSWATKKPAIDSTKCIGCQICAENCPENALSYNNSTEKIELNADFCKGCGICESECPQKAITLKNKE